MNSRQADIQAIMHLKACNGKLTRQQYKTLRGQILAGNAAGAMKGLQKILNPK